MNSIEVGKRIKERRLFLELTQEQLGNPLGLNKSTIQRYETGQVDKIKSPILQEIAKILKTTPAFLMGWEDESSTIEKEQPTSELPLTDDHKRILESVTDLAQEDLEKVIDYALLLKKARNS